MERVTVEYIGKIEVIIGVLKTLATSNSIGDKNQAVILTTI